MLFDPHILVEQPLHILAVVAIIMVGKTLAAMALVILPLSNQYSSDCWRKFGTNW
jgi:predicted Kef-type K+ transport protein